MTVGTMVQPKPLRALQRFFRTPKGYFLIVLAVIAGLAAVSDGIPTVLPGLVGGTVAAVLADMAIVYYLRGEWEFPSGGLLTGMIVALVLRSQESWYVPVCTSFFAIGSKHLFRTRSANVFNPAALGLVLSAFIFQSGQSWWGSLPDFPPVALVVLIALGFYIANHINKIPLVLVFLASYFVLFTSTSFIADPSLVAEIYRSPDVNAVLFFAFFMLDDPPTSPVRYHDQIRFGLIVAVASYTIFAATGGVYYLLAGLLIGNVWEALRRSSTARPRETVVA